MTFKFAKQLINAGLSVNIGKVHLWKRDSKFWPIEKYAVRYAGNERTEYFSNFKTAFARAKEVSLNNYVNVGELEY